MKRQGGQEKGEIRVFVIIEEGPKNYSAYSPDVPGCVATGKTKDETIENMREALAFHLEGLREENLELPARHSQAVELELALA